MSEQFRIAAQEYLLLVTKLSSAMRDEDVPRVRWMKIW